MLERVDKPESLATAQQAGDYDALDHQEFQQRFVDDLVEAESIEGDLLDLGTGTAWVPVLLCRCLEEQGVGKCRIMAADLSVEMLQQARYNIEVHGVIEQVQLDQADARKMLYKDGMFDLVMSHHVMHEFAEPIAVLREAVRVTKENGLLYFRDFLRPDDLGTLDRLVETYGQPENESQQEWFRQSLQAAWQLTEIQSVVEQLGFDAQTVEATDDGHWTWHVRKPETRT